MTDLLEIPDFLDRRNEQPNKRSSSRVPKRKWKLPKPVMPKLPKNVKRRWKKAKEVKLNISNELPRIGCGSRTVFVLEGRKWNYVVEPNGGYQKIAVKIYDEMVEGN